MFATTPLPLQEAQFKQELISFEETLEKSIDCRANAVSRKFAFNFNDEQPFHDSNQQLIVWQKVPDDRLKVRAPICQLKPKRKMSIDSLLSSKTEECSVWDNDDQRDQSTGRGFFQAPTACSVLDENNDSIVSLENAHLNTTFNLSSFASSNGHMSGQASQQNLTSTVKRRKEAEAMPEVVCEVSRESDDSLNDRSSQIIGDEVICSSFQVKIEKRQLLNRIMPHHVLRESEEHRENEMKTRQRDTVKAEFQPEMFRRELHNTVKNDSNPFEMTKQNLLFSRSEVQQMTREYSDNPFGMCDEETPRGVERTEPDEISDDECNFDIDENEECNMDQQIAAGKSIRSTDTKLISFTLSKFR